MRFPRISHHVSQDTSCLRSKLVNSEAEASERARRHHGSPVSSGIPGDFTNHGFFSRVSAARREGFSTKKHKTKPWFEHQVMGLSRNGVWFDMWKTCLTIKYSLGLSIWTWIPSGNQTYGKLSNGKSSACRWFTLNKGFPIAKLHYHRGIDLNCIPPRTGNSTTRVPNFRTTPFAYR